MVELAIHSYMEVFTSTWNRNVKNPGSYNVRVIIHMLLKKEFLNFRNLRLFFGIIMSAKWCPYLAKMMSMEWNGIGYLLIRSANL